MSRNHFTRLLGEVIKYTAMGQKIIMWLCSLLTLLYRSLTREPEMQEWLRLAKPELKLSHKLSVEMATAIDRFYFNHYCRIFQSGAFARATASM